MLGLYHQVISMQLMRDGENGNDDDELKVSFYAAEENDVIKFLQKEELPMIFMKLWFEASSDARISQGKSPQNQFKYAKEEAKNFPINCQETSLDFNPKLGPTHSKNGLSQALRFSPTQNQVHTSVELGPNQTQNQVHTSLELGPTQAQSQASGQNWANQGPRLACT